MDKLFAIAVFAGIMGLAGCADTPRSSTASKDEGDVVTGSRIARKPEATQSVKSVSKEEFTRDSRVIGNAGKGN
jgi:hypothetical protein